MSVADPEDRTKGGGEGNRVWDCSLSGGVEGRALAGGLESEAPQNQIINAFCVVVNAFS